MDLSHRHKIESLTLNELEEFKKIILNIIIEPCEKMYIVGGFAFGLNYTNDIDLIYCIPKSYAIINYPSTPGIGYNYVNKFGKIYEPILKEIFKKRIQIIPNNEDYFLMYDIEVYQSIEPISPYYNLSSHTWINKNQGDIFNKRLIRKNDIFYYVDRN